MQDLPNGEGGGRRSKHWPPGAGDPRYATGFTPSYIRVAEVQMICDAGRSGNLCAPVGL